jgi:hypothetical protein
VECPFKKYKLLGVILTDDLKWKDHVAYIYGKACKRLYSLRILRKAGVETEKMLKVYSAIIRPILEYAVPVWQAIPEYLSHKIESVQRRLLNLEKSAMTNFYECSTWRNYRQDAKNYVNNIWIKLKLHITF